MIEYNIKLIAFPSGKVHEAITPNDDGTVTIFLDKNTTKEYQRKRLLHALKHLTRGDFYKECVQEIECEAHGGENEHKGK